MEYKLSVEYTVTVPDEIGHDSESWEDVKERLEEEIPDPVTVWFQVYDDDGDEVDDEREVTGTRGEVTWHASVGDAVRTV